MPANADKFDVSGGTPFVITTHRYQTKLHAQSLKWLHRTAIREARRAAQRS